MFINKFFQILLLGFIICYAQLYTVSVSQQMIHPPSSDIGLGWSGKIQYTLTCGGYDSVMVSLSIVPAAGGSALQLTRVWGDIGKIHVRNAWARENYNVFFEVQSPQTNVQYIARLIVYADTSQLMKQVENYIRTMSKTEKATLCGGGGTGFEGNGAGPIPQIFMSDGPHGVRPPTGGQATCFPTMAGLASTWDTSLALTEGLTMGEEFRALGKNCALGPAFDLVYHPQGGRASEYCSEDPYLSGHIAASVCRGLQAKGVIATVKHYACNNKEQNRFQLSANMDERSLREIYLYNWKPSFVEAKCWGVMGAYNKVNGSYACSNKYIMTDVLRNEWGYRFLAMTDWGANFDNLTAGMQWGVDIDMPNPDVYTVGAVAGQPDSIVNMHARRIIYAHAMIGDLVSGYNRYAFQNTLMSQAHRDSARKIGNECIVLAKNNNNLLPIPKTGKKIYCTGPFYTQCRLGPGGSSSVNARDRVTPQQGITNLLSSVGAQATTIVTDINQADYVIVFGGVTGETEGSDRPSLQVSTESENAVTTALAAKPQSTIFVFTGGSAASAGNWSNAPAILIAFYPGQEQGSCIADVLFGNVNPSGKLPVTFPQNASQLPNFNLVGGNLIYPRSDTAHGYFRVNKMGVKPLFAFGHGLSYTTFKYSNLKIYPDNIVSGDRVFVSVDVTNTGSVAGKEVVQLYLSMPATNSNLPVRVQDLRGFKKVYLNPGETKKVDFILGPEEMQVFNPGTQQYSGSGRWEILTGIYKVRVGTSSDIDMQPTLSGSFTIQ